MNLDDQKFLKTVLAVIVNFGISQGSVATQLGQGVSVYSCSNSFFVSKRSLETGLHLPTL